MHRFARTTHVTRVIATLSLFAALAAVCATSAGAAPNGTAKATVKYQGKTYTFSGGRCRPILDGFNLMIGKATASKYFTVQESRTMRAGTYHGSVVGLHVNGKYLATNSATVTITKNAK